MIIPVFDHFRENQHISIRKLSPIASLTDRQLRLQIETTTNKLNPNDSTHNKLNKYIHKNAAKKIIQSELNTNLDVNIVLASFESRREELRERIGLRILDSGGPGLGALVAEEHVAVVGVDGTS